MKRRYRVGGMCLSCGKVNDAFSPEREIGHATNRQRYGECDAEKGYAEVLSDRPQPPRRPRKRGA